MRLVLVLSAVAALVSAASLAGAAADKCSTADVYKAIAVLSPTAGNSVSGIVTFTQEGSRVRVVAEVSGLPPNSRHGFHIHEFGDVSAPDATSAGGHYNPAGHPHGGPASAQKHGGDFGNLVSDANGKARLELVASGISVSCGPACILGRGVIVHEKEDDLKSQPTGNAGARVASGVIGVAREGVRKAEAGTAAAGASAGATASGKAAVYTCPHHTDLRTEKAGKCPRCGMELVKAGK